MFTRPPIRVIIIFMICVCIPMIVIIYRNFANNMFRIEISQFYLPLCKYSSRITDNRIVFDNTSYFIPHYPEFICPQNFRNLADWIFSWPKNTFNEHIENNANDSYAIVPNLPHGSIIYLQPNGILTFFRGIYPYLQNKFVLITGQSDYSVPGQYLYYLERSDSKIIHWFGQNGDIDALRSERFTHIPIGINCFEMAKSIRSIHREYRNYTLPSVVNKSVDEPFHYIQPFDITQRVLNSNNQSDKLLLLNFHPDTDPDGLRRKLWQNICENKKKYSFVTCFDKPSGVDIEILQTIYKRNRQYPLWLSPRGNGIDCHRTWEALYLDAIPIVWHSTIDSLYSDLPIIIINNWNEINEQFLRNKLYEIALKKLQQPSVYRYEKLRHSFWRDMILKKSRHSSAHTHIHKNRCWQAKTIQ
ncbi:unnamed protein product [Rotaria sp. Silwood2]|nr:unnamed protein product [Rotaria sp. Silwood2]CAF4231293.1 unnamed protein product [Rotaria sp. Silwood2]